jgi:hypothetical protein
MGELLNTFIEYVDSGNAWIALLILAVYFILRKEPFKVYAHFDNKRSMDIELLLNVLASNDLSKETKAFFKDRLEQISFRKFQGITASKTMRVALVKFYQDNEKEIEWHNLKRAYPYIHLTGSQMSVEIKWYNEAENIWLMIMKWGSLLYALLLIVLSVWMFFTKIDGASNLAFMGIAVFAAAVLFSSLSWPFQSAKRIQRIIDPPKGKRKKQAKKS